MAYGESAMEQPPPMGDQNPACHADVCVTCSDEAVPVRIVRLLPRDLAMVEIGSGSAQTGSAVEEISVALVDAPVGATVLVHAGEAIAVVDDGRGGGTDVPRNTR